MPKISEIKQMSLMGVTVFCFGFAFYFYHTSAWLGSLVTQWKYCPVLPSLKKLIIIIIIIIDDL